MPSRPIVKDQQGSEDSATYYGVSDRLNTSSHQYSMAPYNESTGNSYDQQCYGMWMNQDNNYTSRQPVTDDSHDPMQNTWANPWAPTRMRNNRPEQSVKQGNDNLHMRLAQQTAIPEGRVVGVYFDKQRRIWRANWREHGQGKRKTKNFSVDDYGFEEARRMAIQYRLAKLMEASDKAMLQHQSQSQITTSTSSMDRFDTDCLSHSQCKDLTDKNGCPRTRRRRRYAVSEPIPSLENVLWPPVNPYNVHYNRQPMMNSSAIPTYPGMNNMCTTQQPYMMWSFDCDQNTYAGPEMESKEYGVWHNWENVMPVDHTSNGNVDV